MKPQVKVLGIALGGAAALPFDRSEWAPMRTPRDVEVIDRRWAFNEPAPFPLVRRRDADGDWSLLVPKEDS